MVQMDRTRDRLSQCARFDHMVDPMKSPLPQIMIIDDDISDVFVIDNRRTQMPVSNRTRGQYQNVMPTAMKKIGKNHAKSGRATYSSEPGPKELARAAKRLAANK